MRLLSHTVQLQSFLVSSIPFIALSPCHCFAIRKPGSQKSELKEIPISWTGDHSSMHMGTFILFIIGPKLGQCVSISCFLHNYQYNLATFLH